MPLAAPKPCCHPGCNTLAHDGTSRCTEHKRPAWQPTINQVKRTTGRKLQAQRAALFAREPWCCECIKRGVERFATIRDHVKPLAEGGLDDDDNVQGLCEDCHDVKTAAESVRGRVGGVVRHFKKRSLETWDPLESTCRHASLSIL